MQLATKGACDFADLSQLTLARFDDLENDWQEEKGWTPWSPAPQEAAS
jgi:hypothetical protein